ncbi:MAG: Fic family protein [Patescibacteria group bacterium]
MKFAQKQDIFDIPTDSLSSIQVLEAWEQASHYLGQVNQLSTSIFDLSFIIDTLKNIEALNSAKIEGTTGNLEDLYMEDFLSLEKKKELKLFSALNYKYTINELERIVAGYGKIDAGLIRHLHKLLTKNDPATHGDPGIFRTTQVKIRNSKLGDFFPPEPFEVSYLVTQLFEKVSNLPDLSLPWIAIRHFQFEAIHPFEDGNGRTGRLLILAYLLLNKKHLSAPILNISQFFEKNRDEYVYHLRNVTDVGDYKKWTLFFLKGVEEQSREVVRLINELRNIKRKDEEVVTSSFRNSSTPLLLLDFSLQEFFFTITEFEAYLKKKKVPLKAIYQTARNNILRFEQIGLLKKSHKRGLADTYVHVGLRKVLMEKK